MKTVNDNKAFRPTWGKRIGAGVVVASFLAVAVTGCKKDELNELGPDMNNPAAMSEGTQPGDEAARSAFGIVNLVADMDGYGATRIDGNLMNAWGMDFAPDGSIWIAANMHGSALVYDKDGMEVRSAVSISDATTGTGPVGVLSNRTGAFIVPSSGRESQMLFTTQDGKVVARSYGTNYTAIDRSATGALYTGIDVAYLGSQPYLYVADFANGKVDVFDKNLVYQRNFRFTDPTLPAGYKPYNVKTIGNRIWVVYAKQVRGATAEVGRGTGIISIFDADGQFVRRFATAGNLNAPWGIEVSNRHIFVANHGDGRVNVFDLHARYIGQINLNGRPMEIAGLWNISHNGPDQTYLYFTSSPTTDDGRPHGVFGYIKRAQ